MPEDQLLVDTDDVIRLEFVRNRAVPRIPDICLHQRLHRAEKEKAPQIVKPARPCWCWLPDLGSNQGPTD